MAKQNMIEIKNLVKRFGDFKAVDDISLSVKEGEIFGILGPNGAGKTTTINVVLGLLKPTSGSVKIDDLDAHANPERIKQMLGLMTQETVVEGDLTAWDNLELFAELYHVPKGEIPKRVKRALEDAELTDKAYVRAGTFSGGMKRRLELVKSMIQEPKVLILDEPTTGLDVQNRHKLWERIKELNQKGITIILTTQYLEEADALCDRLAIIDHGKIKAIGTVSELKSKVGKGNILEIIVKQSETNDALRILKKFGVNGSVKVDRVVGNIEKEPTKTFNKISNELEKQKISVLSISMHLPTLDDVFITLTGSKIRDEAGGSDDAARMRAWRGR
ncbi:MAG: ATP-binding cassette domain-containing protein [Candidatus Micrarchaeota archaeon]|nr:ATP-binding cassette domain-containing protein [Candidatus Micrarchaeota archaeon]